MTDEALIEEVIEALRSRYLATCYDAEVHWRDMALAAIEVVQKKVGKSNLYNRMILPSLPEGEAERARIIVWLEAQRAYRAHINDTDGRSVLDTTLRAISRGDHLTQGDRSAKRQDRNGLDRNDESAGPVRDAPKALITK